MKRLLGALYVCLRPGFGGEPSPLGVRLRPMGATRVLMMARISKVLLALSFVFACASTQATNYATWEFDDPFLIINGSTWACDGNGLKDSPQWPGYNASQNFVTGTDTWNGQSGTYLEGTGHNAGDETVAGCYFQNDGVGTPPMRIDNFRNKTVYMRTWIRLGSNVTYSNQHKWKAHRWQSQSGMGTHCTSYVYAYGFGPWSHQCDNDAHLAMGDSNQAVVPWDMDPSDGNCRNGAPNNNTQPACTAWNEYIIAYHYGDGVNFNGHADVFVNGVKIGAYPYPFWNGQNGTGINQEGSGYMEFWWAGWSWIVYAQNMGGLIQLDHASVDDTWNSDCAATEPTTVGTPGPCNAVRPMAPILQQVQ